MSNVIIGDIVPYTQAVATGGQTVFGTNWTANAASDVVVYQTPNGMAPNDATQVLAYPVQFSVAFIGALQQVQVTLTIAANAGDIVTITRQTPASYLNLYTNTNFTPSMLNNDFDIMTLVDQQAQLVNQLIAPRYNYSAVIAPNLLFPNANIILPILGANQIWVKAADNNSIVAVNIPGGGGGGGGGVNAGLQNEIAWYAATGSTVSGLPTVANSVLMTDGAGVPFLGQTLPNAVQSNITQLGTQIQNLNMGGFGINNLLNPINPQDAATKDYVDMIAAGIQVLPSVSAGTTANLNATYNNAAAGVGATLTNAGAMAAFATDGVSPAINSRILVKNQTDPTQNGIYTLTTVGSGAANWVLTRATNYDTPAQINPGDFFLIDTGATQAGEAWIETQVVATIGTDPINFSLFSTGVFALKGANADITSMSALTGYLQAPLGIKDANGNVVVYFSQTAAAINSVNLLNNVSGSAPVVAAVGGDANVQLQLNGKGTSGVGIQGVSTNTAAAAGNVGEEGQSIVLYAASINPPNNAIFDLTSVVVPTGDFDVWAVMYYHSTLFSIGVAEAWINSASVTSVDLALTSSYQVNVANGFSQATCHVVQQRFLNAAPTRVYLSGITQFSGGTINVAGGIFYRRRS